MSNNPTVGLNFSPGVISLIPMFYVAWMDRVLTPSEISILRDKAMNLTFLSPQDKRTIHQWSNPLHPPSRQLFKFWEIELHKIAPQFDSNATPTLVDLGLKMAAYAEQKLGDQYGLASLWVDKTVRIELEEIESLLGMVSIDAYRTIFSEHAEKRQELEEEIQASFDIPSMTRLLDGDNHEVCQKMRNLLKDPVFAFQTLRDKDAYRNQVLAWCKLLAAQGLGSVAFPEQYGGKNNMGHYVTIFEMLGYHDLSLAIKFGVHFGLFGGSVLWLGTEKHHKEYLAKIGTLELPGCFAMTETGHGSNVRGLETTATYDEVNDEIIIHTPSVEAGKEYIGNALHGEMASVFAQLIVKGENHGVHAVLVPLRSKDGVLMPGVKVEDCGYKMGLNGVDNGRIWFDQVRVPRANLLNRFGSIDDAGNYSSPIADPSRRFFTMLGTLVGGRVSVPKAGLSATKSGLAIAIKYGLKRRQFGPNFKEPETILLDYPSHQKRLMPLLAKAYAVSFALNNLAKRYVANIGTDIREIETLAAGMKAYSTWFTTAALQECREACGGKGYLAENRFADLKADTDIFTTFEGDNTVLMQLVARGVLSDFKKEFHEEGTVAILRYIGDRLGTAIAELNPIAIRNSDKQHLLDSSFHLSAFQFREKRILYALANRLRHWIKQGIGAYNATLKCQNHLLSLAHAYIERMVLEQFQQQIEAVDDKATRQTLTTLCQLYALSTIHEHRGWYLENDYMAGGKTKAIRREIEELCTVVRKEAHALVTSFGIPDECLAAQIVVSNN